MSPAGSWTSSRRYLDRTLVLETTFSTSAGTFVLTDAMALGPDNCGHRIGRDVPHLLVRKLACTHGEVEVEVDYQPRPEYGLIVPVLGSVPGGITARGGAEWLVLTADGLSIDGPRAHGRRRLRAGEEVYLAVHRSTLEEIPARVWSQADLAEILTRTVQAWRSWSALHQTYDGPWADLVHHSGIVLQGLSFQPSGAIIAAATTSLPEFAGGGRNWDYRYAWVRDASFTMEALWVAACPDEGRQFLCVHDHRCRLVAGHGRRAADHVWHRGRARPVRARARDTCLAGVTAARSGSATVPGTSSRSTCTANCSVRPAASLATSPGSTATPSASWWRAPTRPLHLGTRKKDQGIWEIQVILQHFLYSKVMCWVALDRALALADLMLNARRPSRPVEDHAEQDLWETVVRDGWNEQANAFTQYFGSTALDAANLMMANVGFLPADDPRMLATIDAINAGASLMTEGSSTATGRRRASTAWPREGTFLMCTFWLAQALALAGQLDRAGVVFGAIAFMNDVGLLAEEVAPVFG